MAKYRAGVVGLGRMGSTFDDEIGRGGDGLPTILPRPELLPFAAGRSGSREPTSMPGNGPSSGRDGAWAPNISTKTTTRWWRRSAWTSSACARRPGIAPASCRTWPAAVSKAIWAEKPISPSLEEADEMVRVCREEGAQLAINCSRRWNPLFSEAKSIIDAGDLGDILQVTVYAECGLSTNGSHLLDLVRFLAGGEVKWVTGEIEADDEVGDSEGRGNGYLAFDNGVRSFIRTTACGPAYWEVDVIGERGRIRSLGNAQEVELYLSADYDPDSRAIRPMSNRVATPFSAKYPFPLAEEHTRLWPHYGRGPGQFHRNGPAASLQRRGWAQGAGNSHRNAGIPSARRRQGHLCRWRIAA